jgi:hypothetical protein
MMHRADATPQSQDIILTTNYQAGTIVIDCTPTDLPRATSNAGFAVESVETTTMWTLPVAVVVGNRVE